MKWKDEYTKYAWITGGVVGGGAAIYFLWKFLTPLSEAEKEIGRDKWLSTAPLNQRLHPYNYMPDKLLTEQEKEWKAETSAIEEEAIRRNEEQAAREAQMTADQLRADELRRETEARNFFISSYMDCGYTQDEAIAEYNKTKSGW